MTIGDEKELRADFGLPEVERSFTKLFTGDNVAKVDDEKVVAWMTPGGDVSRSFDWCDERCMPPAEPIPLILQSAYAELAADRDAMFIRAREWAELSGANEARAEKAESQLAELRGAMEKIGRRAADHPDDDDADRKRNLYHISAIVKGTLAAADGG